MIELGINVPEGREFIKEMVEVPGRIFEIMWLNVRETVGRYPSLLMKSELTFMLGRERYERARGKQYEDAVREDPSLMFLLEEGRVSPF